MTVVELRALCKSKHVKGYSKMRKNQLIKACKNIPDSPIFYRFRGQKLRSASLNERIEDYNKVLTHLVTIIFQSDIPY